MRRRLALTALGSIGIICLVIAIGAALVGRKHYLGFIEDTLRNEAAARGVRIATRNFDIFPIGIRATEVDAYLVRYLLTLTIGNPSARLADLSPTMAFTGEAYGGAITGTVARPWFSGEVSTQGTLAAVNLSKHPQLNALGVNSGLLDLTIIEATVDATTQRLERARFEGKVSGFSRTTPLSIRPGQFGSPFGVTIPPIPPTDLEVSGSVSGGRLSLSRAKVTTELGEISASGDIHLEGPQEVAVDALLSLSPAGAAKVGPYLPLVSQGAVDPDATKVRLVVRGPLKAPRLKWSRAG